MSRSMLLLDATAYEAGAEKKTLAFTARAKEPRNLEMVCLAYKPGRYLVLTDASRAVLREGTRNC
jgi:hypothetical protein